MILIGGLLGAAALLIATGMLVRLNWNHQIAATFVSIVLGGTVTLLIAVFTQLKESSVTGQFFVEVPIDSATGQLHFDRSIPFDAMRWRMHLQSILAQPYLPPVRTDAGVQATVTIPSEPITNEELFHRATQLMQYKVLTDLRDNQPTSRSTPLVLEGQEIPSVQRPAPAAPVADIPRQVLESLLAANRFHSSHEIGWFNRTLRLPKGASMHLKHFKSSPETGLERDVVMIERAHYYAGAITIEALGAGSAGTSTVKNVRVALTMRAKFHRFAAGSKDSADAKAWFEWLFAMLAEANHGLTR